MTVLSVLNNISFNETYSDQIPSWRSILKKNFTKIDDLALFLELDPIQKLELDIHPEFILNLPYRLAAKIEKANPLDPLFLQFVPTKKEGEFGEGFALDPVQDQSFRKEAKLLQKYHGRSLILTCSACAMHCRYCFRKNFPYETSVSTFEKELDALRAQSTIEEIILSGGDPLSLSDRALENLLHELDQIPHIQRIRFHTRFPIGIPERLDDSFIQLLSKRKKQVWFVIHTNHPKELDEDIWQALARVQRLGIPVLSQTVLLQGVNDSFQTLYELFRSLVNHGVMPYYLFGLDRVQGTQHFEVDKDFGKKLIQELMQNLPGYAIPKFVQEIPGEPSKTPL